MELCRRSAPGPFVPAAKCSSRDRNRGLSRGSEVVIMLHTVMLVAHAIVKRKPRCPSKAILTYGAPVLVAITASIGSRNQRWSYRAGRALDQIARNTSFGAGERSLGG